MNEEAVAQWQQRLRETAASFPYPATPDVAGAVQQRLAARQTRSIPVRRRLAWGIALLLLIISGLMAVPQVRAAVLRIVRAGAITIFVSEPTTPNAPGPSVSDEFIFDLATPTTLAEAQARAKIPLKLPTYPPDLGAPDHVYIEEADRQSAIIMVWLKPGQADEVRLSLYHIEVDDYAYKTAEHIKITRVNGREAFWLDAPHYFRLGNGRYQPWRFVAGNVLIWWPSEDVTYRLESGLPLAEAVRIAESLK
ncbi:MAG: hypothetical protein ACE5E7_19070 [Anaerolineae bacterium]